MGTPPVQYRFQPGVSGNKSGKPKQLLTKDKLSGLMGKFAHMSRKQLREYITNDDEPILDLAVAAIFLKAANNADCASLEFLLTRSLGRVKEELEQTIRTISDEELDSIPRQKIIELVQSGG